ncbi:MAG: PAS domain S-box protein [Desulfomonilaceae bacterium]
MIILNLIQNIALLVALAATYQVIGSRLEKKNVVYKILSGLLFGGVGLVAMLTPLNFMPGVIFDGRSIILSVSGLFGGPLVAAVAATICGSYRLWLGGPGAWVGFSVIVESATLGVVFHFLWKSTVRQIAPFSLYIFGLTVHFVMLALMLALPGGTGTEVLRQIGLPTLVVYPLATMLLCRIFLDYETRLDDRKALRESEGRYRGVFENAAIGIDVVDAAGRLLEVNGSLAKMLGYSQDELLKRTIFDITHPEDVEVSRTKHEQMVRGEMTSYRFEKRYVRKNGELLWAEVSVSLIRGSDGVHIATIGVVADITERKRVEQALEDNEQMLKSLLAASPVGILFTQHSKIKWANDAWVTMFGFEDEREYIDQPTRILHSSQEEYQRVRSILYGNLKPGKVSETDARLKRKDGSAIDVHIRVNFLDPSDLAKGTISALSDVSDRKRSEEELQKSQERLNLALKGADLGLWDLDVQTGQAVANQRAAEMAGYSLDEIEQNFVFWERLLHPDDRQKALESVFNHLAGLTEHYEDEYRVRHKSGDSRWIFSRGKITERDQDGKPLRMTGTYLDITDRKTFELQVAEANELRENIVSKSPMGIAVYKADGQCISANEALGRIVGADRERLLTQNFHNLTSWKDSGLLADAEEVLSGSINSQREVHITTTFGKSVWVNARMARLTSGGEPHLLLAFNDITERKKAEEEQDHLKAQLSQAQKMESIGTLAGGIAHDFNNLLTVVQGFSELLLMEMDQKAPGYSDLLKIYEAGLKGAELVRNLLAFSRKADIKPRPINLNHEVTRIEKLLSRTIPKMIKIELHLEGDLAAVNADPDQMGQVLMNLAVNAEQAMPDGGNLTIATANIFLNEEHCRSYPEIHPGDHVLLTVSDTGHGMDKETLGHIFEPFFTTKEVGKGTGLGLAMVYGIVKLHGGHIGCESEPNRGSTFKIYLPAIEEDATERGVKEEQALPRGGTETILLVDDEDFIRDLGSRFLIRAGYTVIKAANGPEAIELYLREGERISLVILDLIMPEMGGDKCLEEILAINPHAKIVISSGAAVEGKKKETLESGARGFVSKPFRLRDMLKTVREVLDSV